MKYIISRYNHDISWVKDYTDDFVLYDRSEEPLEGSIVMQNIGSDWYDKLTFIIDNYDNLPDVAVYTKANLFKYIDKDEFEVIKDNTTFTPILSQRHQEKKDFCFYRNGMYYELNNLWYTRAHPVTNDIQELGRMLGIQDMYYVPFAPGSNYILPKANILQHPRNFYIILRRYLERAVYPGEAMIIERGAYTLFNLI